MEPEWDQLSIETPELVSIEMPVAGIGSRFVALLVDYLILTVAVALLAFLKELIVSSEVMAHSVGAKWTAAIYTLVLFVLYWGYFSLFEAFWNGRTPGKQIAKIRVIQFSGRGIGLYESLTRNLLRVVDQFPLIYGVGVISIFLTKQHQRLGDLAAGTLVVHEREHLNPAISQGGGRTFTAGMFEEPVAPATYRVGFEVAPSGVQRLTATDLEVLEGFFARRLDFSLETRAMLAQRILVGILGKSGLVVPAAISTETFLEEVARQLRDMVRLQR